jgi:cyclohexanone monooxygenase
MPLLEETGYIPKEKYAFGDEILDYTKQLAATFDLDRDACFQTSVTGARWDDDAHRWVITTDKGDEMRARFVIHSTGVLNRPKLPGLEGIEDFRGHSFHTSRWDYAYTGGGPNGDLTGLRDKRRHHRDRRVGHPGRAPLGEAAQHLYVFQRTRRRSTCGATAPPTRRGSRPSNPAGSRSASATST